MVIHVAGKYNDKYSIINIVTSLPMFNRHWSADIPLLI